jgi:raffinose/stachyose/melibiose transport system substrate-binding protein
MRSRSLILPVLLAAVLVVSVAGSRSDAATLRIESWRSDDAAVWRDIIIPAFQLAHATTRVEFTPTPPTEYNAALNVRLSGGIAGDLITCRPFDASLELYRQGHLVALDGLPGMEHFPAVAKAAWQTDDGAVTFCLPMASVIHGFIYNREIFAELGLAVPRTEAEFFAVLERLREDRSYTPMSMGTADQWEAATMGFQNVGPNYWHGEAGRRALIDGTARLTDPAYVAVFENLARWQAYLGRGFKAQSYADSQTLFTLGRAAIYPAGSWEIAGFRAEAEFELGVFAPPPREATDECYISDHTDIGIGINASSPNAAEALTFLTWLTGAKFANLFANALPGFFPLSDHRVEISDPVAQEFISWRERCQPTIRNTYQVLSRGTPNLENELWNVSVQVIHGTMTPREAAERLQSGLESWYEPHQP